MASGMGMSPEQIKDQEIRGNMRFYKIEFLEHSYDEYDSMVIVAPNLEEAVKAARNAAEADEPVETTYSQAQWDKGYVIKQITPQDYNKPEMVIGSFNAG